MDGNARVGARMGHKVSLAKLINERGEPTHPRYRWRATFVEGGKRKQKYFKTKTAADDWKDSKEQEHFQHGSSEPITYAERSIIVGTRRELEEMGVSLSDAIALAVYAARLFKDLATSPREGLEFAAGYFRQAQVSSTVSEMVETTVRSRIRSNKSQRYIKDIESKLGRFSSAFGDRPVSTISKREIEDWLHRLGLAPGSLNSYRRHLVVLFSQCCKDGLLQSNPAQAVLTVKNVTDEIGILSVEETRRLLRVADPRILPSIVIGAFCGVRTEELGKLDWSDLRLRDEGSNLLIPAGAAKTAKRRVIDLEDNVVKWLLSIAQKEGPIWPVNGRKLFEKAKLDAGFGSQVGGENLPEGTSPGLRPWPRNGLRHSFASYHLAHFRDASRLALAMGHASNQIIFKHYREIVDPGEAAKYWQITPEIRSSSK